MADADDVIRYLEIAHIPPSDAGAYPGLYLFTSPARFMRPVRRSRAIHLGIDEETMMRRRLLRRK